MQAVADTLFTAELLDVDPDSTVLDMGARIEVPVTRAIVSYWRRATLVGDPASLEGQHWEVAIEAPPAPGEYNLVWRTGDPEPPAFEAVVPLTVTLASAVVADEWPVVDVAQVRPSQEEVAALENTRLVASGSRDVIEFTDETNPTVAQVEQLIDQAVPLVLGELPNAFPVAYYDTVRNAVALYTAMLIEGSHFRQQADEGSAELWRTLYNTAILNIKRSIDADLKQWRILRARATPQGARILA